MQLWEFFFMDGVNVFINKLKRRKKKYIIYDCHWQQKLIDFVSEQTIISMTNSLNILLSINKKKTTAF